MANDHFTDAQVSGGSGQRPETLWLIDDFSNPGASKLGTPWRAVSDQVMGGVSTASLRRLQSADLNVICLEGDVSLENNGGFAQINLDLSADGPLDASGYTGVWLIQRGNGADYSLHLKTTATRLPWQSYRAGFSSTADWVALKLPFADFVPHRIDQPLDPARLKRLGLVAIGREMTAELCVAEVGFYRDGPVRAAPNPD
ncbi:MULTISPECIES: CIA30 family protein [Thiorhodovibrio]|uniref:CIA30 family protein n=1 Tax=Thiorhodovibrio TaxID=61593 RepID=UPI0019130801|nr:MULTISPECIES: CIA30 family protein [Thiorhodovibrio]MBK5968344.1 NADH:ubiquinone oxidoreductase [Thiorhodovibrio winogradskyi]WPL13207.1 Complex I intermediate-associated protein 30 (CIA30) [Thiorhodovibrio litoralis]